MMGKNKRQPQSSFSASSFSLTLVGWLDSLAKEDKEELDKAGLGALAMLRYVRLDEGFLRAAMKYWDPVVHVFRFKKDELVPLPEEFSAILGWPTRTLPCLPSTSEYHYMEFQSFFHLSSSELSSCVHGRGVDLTSFARLFLSPSSHEVVYRRRALCFCLYCHYLFSQRGYETGHASLVSVVRQALEGRDPTPVIIGETMVALDLLHLDPSLELFGSPLLLQIWLFERLSLVASIPQMERYNPKGFVRRKNLVEDKSPEDWERYFIDTELFNFRWTVSWWGLTRMRSTDTSVLEVPSLSVMTFYFPVRVMRQFGMKQLIPSHPMEQFEAKVLTEESVNEWEQYWLSQPLWDLVTPAEATHLPLKYLRWLKEKDNLRLQRHPSGKRKVTESQVQPQRAAPSTRRLRIGK